MHRLLSISTLFAIAFGMFMSFENDRLKAKNGDLQAQSRSYTIENTALKVDKAKLEARLAPKPEPAELPKECPIHSEPVQQADGSWLLVCIDHLTTYGTGKILYLLQSNPDALGGWTAIEHFPFRATITDPPFPDPNP